MVELLITNWIIDYYYFIYNFTVEDVPNVFSSDSEAAADDELEYMQLDALFAEDEDEGEDHDRENRNIGENPAPSGCL